MSMISKGAAGVATSADGTPVYFTTGTELAKAMETATDIYFAANSSVTLKSHEAKIPATGITIHGNGATITGGECDLALEYTTFVENSTVDIYVENLNNARV